MASTYSALKIELIATGEQSGTWGTTTNTNLGDAALGEAITGSADVAFSSADVTVTLTDTNATQAARNLRLNLTGTTGGARSLILGSGCQIEKLYLINNTCADAITVKNTTGTGIAVAAGKSMFVYNNGTNVVDAVTHATSLTLGSALPIASGGTGSTSTTYASLTANVTGTLPVANGGTGITSLGTGVATFLGTPSSANLAAALTDETGTGANVFATSPTLVTPVLGTPASGTLSSCTGLPLTTGVTGTLPVANGGTGVATLTTAYGVVAAGTTATGALQNIGTGTTGQILTSNGAGVLPSFQAAAGGGGLGGTTVFTADGTFTIPTGKTVVKVTVQAGGGGSGGRSNAAGGWGDSGGGGGYTVKYLTGLTPGNTLAVTRGAGGTAGSSGGSSGGTGGTSSVASGTQTITTISATGGGGGTGNQYSGSQVLGSNGGAGGSTSGGDYSVPGGVGYSIGIPSTANCAALGFGLFAGGNSMLSMRNVYAASTAAASYVPNMASVSGVGYGGGATGVSSLYSYSSPAGAVGAGGIIIFEY